MATPPTIQSGQSRAIRPGNLFLALPWALAGGVEQDHQHQIQQHHNARPEHGHP